VNILILGGGGRESALAGAFARSPQSGRIIVSPGNDGLQHPLSLVAGRVETVDLPDVSAVAEFVRREQVGLVFIGPEKPLAEGWADELRLRGIDVVGPSRAAARIESSKAFAKQLCRDFNIPTADSVVFDEPATAMEYLRTAPCPLVIKADGLAEGKGVVIAHTREEAEAALRAMMNERVFGDSGARVVIEEFMEGWEASLFAFTDGQDYVTTIFSQDHKPLLDGDHGPNTGGMGAYAPVLAAEPWREQIESEIIAPALRGLRERGCPYQGVLYAGLMFTSQGPKVVEFNCRFGDPETEAVLPLLTTDLIDICRAITSRRVRELRLTWRPGGCVAVTAASGGYPGSVRKGLPISCDPASAADSSHWIDFAGVTSRDGVLTTSGGRVLMSVALGDSLKDARNAAYNVLSLIRFDGMQFRTDIGCKALKASGEDQS
jgi:phosphoribosylamine---glycine ligase